MVKKNVKNNNNNNKTYLLTYGFTIINWSLTEIKKVYTKVLKLCVNNLT